MPSQIQDQQRPRPPDDVSTGGVPARASAVPEAPAPEPLPPGFIHQMRFDQLRSLTALSVSATGGGLVALQAGLLERSPLVAIPLVCLGFAAVVALLAQRQLVTDLERTSTVGQGARLMAQMAEGLLGMGIGSAVAIFALL